MSGNTDHSRRNFLAGATASAAMLGFGALNTRPVKAQGKYVVRIGSVWKEDNITPDVDEEFIELLHEHSKGEFDAKFFPAGALGSALERSQKLQAGTLEVSNTSLSNFAAYVPFYNALNFPYVTRGYEGTRATIENGLKIINSKRFDDAASKAAKEKGFEVAFWTPIGVRQIAIREQKNLTVKTPEDIKGVKMRVTGSQVERNLFDFLGANPAPVSWPETYTSLQKGVVDGIHNSSVSLYGFNMYELCGSVTKTNLYPTLNLYVASRKWLEGLPKHLQEAFTKACREAGEIQRAKLWESEDRATKALVDSGIEIYEPTGAEYEKWVEAVSYEKPMWEPHIKELVGSVETFNDILGL